MLKNNNNAVLELFFRNPTKKFNVREVAKLAGITPPTASYKLKRLEKEKLIKKETKANLILHSANMDNKAFIDKKRINNLSLLYNSEIIYFLKEEYDEPDAIILFGTYSKGEDVETSDIDIAIITNKDKDLDLTKYEKKFERRIHILRLKKNELTKEFKNTLANGMVLSGYLTIK